MVHHESIVIVLIPVTKEIIVLFHPFINDS